MPITSQGKDGTPLQPSMEGTAGGPLFFRCGPKPPSIAVLVTLGVLFTTRTDQRKTEEPMSQTAQEKGTGSPESAINKVDSAAAAPVTVNPVIVNPVQAAEATIITAGQSPQTVREKSDYRARQAVREKSDYKARQAAGSLLAETGVAERSAIPESIKAGGVTFL